MYSVEIIMTNDVIMMAILNATCTLQFTEQHLQLTVDMTINLHNTYVDVKTIIIADKMVET